MNVNEGLRDLVADEPPYVLDVEGALAGGRRRRRGRVTAVLSGVGLTVGAVAAGVVLLTPATPHDVLTPAAQPPAAAEGDGSLFYRVVRANTPAAWTITSIHSDGESWWADVDDGRGAQRVGISYSRGGLQLHPCSDSEYVNGATCTETELSATSRLIVRGVSHDGPQKAYASAYAEIVHPNGYGTSASIDNATWKELPEGKVLYTEDEKRELTKGTIVNPVPLYSTDQLVAMVKQYEAAIG